MTFVARAQPVEDVKFESITIADGLSNDQVNCVFQDQQGFIWIGTLSGLNRYDGYEVKNYYHEDSNPNSLLSNTILWMADGPDELIWIRNTVGINTYNPYTQSFSLPTDYLNTLQTESSFISKMVNDGKGNFWFNINNLGVVKITSGGETIKIDNSKDADIKVSSNSISDITLDSENNLWTIYEDGIEVIDNTSNKVMRRYGLPAIISGNDHLFKKIFVDSDGDAWVYSVDNPIGLFYLNTRTSVTKILDGNDLTSPLVRGIVEHESGKLWIGSDHGGISILNKKNWQIQSVLSDQDAPKSLINNNVNNVFKDRNGGVWIGTHKSGVSYYHQSGSNFSHYKFARKESAYNDMSSFAEDRNGNIWIGTNGGGLLKFNVKKNSFSSILDDHTILGEQPRVIVSLLYDSEGILWVGSYLNGLYQFDGKQFTKFDAHDDLKGSSIWDLFEDSRNEIWIGTLNKGAFRYDRKSGDIANYGITNFLTSNYTTCIEEDADGDIWIGTGVGLNVIDPNTNETRQYISENAIDHPLGNNSVISIHKDQLNRIWIGTLDGLNLFHKESEDFEVLKMQNGLSSNIIMSILSDDKNNLWISTARGITKLTVTDHRYEYQTYDISDGLQDENFTEDASLKTSDGHLIFSGQNGFNIFDPNEIKETAHEPEILLTKFSVYNEPVLQGTRLNGRVLFDQPLNSLREINLKHHENSVSFEYLALSFFQSGKIRYQYQLEGFDVDWITATSDARKANYTNLDYGEYTFKVRYSAGANAWSNDVISLKIRISPPWWETVWAFAGYFVLLIVLLYLTRTYIVYRERLKASIENERREVERQHQLDLMKIKFFTNISHEFRTPLSLVLTPIERMIKYPEKIKQGDLTIVQRNAKRLMTLVNQLLDFRKMEANQHSLSQSSGDIIMFLQDVVDSFSDWSKEKDIPVVFSSENKSFYTFFDKDKMEKVMFNLLSNAFKFTLPGGKINVDFELQSKEEGGNAIIMVSDTGIGIPEDKLQLIFNRFFQNELTGDIINNGTGIGLSITKEFVELHGGKITVESKPNMGSTFIVQMPLKEINSDEDLADELVKELAESVKQTGHLKVPEDQNKPLILLVEDNFDFRFYLKDNLKQFYNVTVASNGKEAWKMILNQPPDIVISDVMMPVMDGHELCEKIKTDPRTLQIPVILLTAQSSDKHRIQGLEAGAIEYISKPFNFEILISSINSALKFQKRVQESGKKIHVEPSEVDIVSLDEQLIAKAVLLVEENMSNSEFSVEDLSHELGYSRGHFYQKILRLTGQTPIDFIRNIRMKRAADLLKRSQLNVSEVAYKVGYNNPKLFSRYFKTQYQMYPSEFRIKSEDI